MTDTPGGCPTCSWPNRETSGMVCQTCGADYSIPLDTVRQASAAFLAAKNDYMGQDLAFLDGPMRAALSAVNRARAKAAADRLAAQVKGDT